MVSSRSGFSGLFAGTKSRTLYRGFDASAFVYVTSGNSTWISVFGNAVSLSAGTIRVRSSCRQEYVDAWHWADHTASTAIARRQHADHHPATSPPDLKAPSEPYEPSSKYPAPHRPPYCSQSKESKRPPPAA